MVAGAQGKSYSKDDHIEIFAIRGGPYMNPSETYSPSFIPHCHYLNQETTTTNKEKDNHQTPPLNFFEELVGFSKTPIANVTTGTYEIINSHENDEEKNIVLTCRTKPLSYSDSEKLSKAIRDRWFFEWNIDGLPTWGMFGEMLPKISRGNDIDPLFLSSHHDSSQLLPYVYTTRNLVIRTIPSSSIIHNHVQKQREVNQHIFQIDLTSEPSSFVEVTPSKNNTGIEYRLNIRFEQQDLSSADVSRFDRYVDYSFFYDIPAHRFSMFNSCIIVLVLGGFLARILWLFLSVSSPPSNEEKIVKRETSPRKTDEQKADGDESHDVKGVIGASLEEGIKHEEGDMTTPLLLSNQEVDHDEENDDDDQESSLSSKPKHPVLLSVLLGTGWQVASVISFFILYSALRGIPHSWNQTDFIAIILPSFVLSGCLLGYLSMRFYQTLSTSCDTSSCKVILQVAPLMLSLFPGIVAIVFGILQFSAKVKGTNKVVSYLVILKLVCLFVFAYTPLCLVGCYLGVNHHKFRGFASSLSPQLSSSSSNKSKRQSEKHIVQTFEKLLSIHVSDNNNNSKIKNFVRKLFERRPLFILPIPSLIAFGTIIVELYFVESCLWSYKMCAVWIYIALSFVFMILTSACGGALMAGFGVIRGQGWHWVTFTSGALLVFWMLLYSAYYLLFRSGMHGWYQVVSYFGTMSLMSLSLGLVCGSVSYACGEMFVNVIYRNTKVK